MAVHEKPACEVHAANSRLVGSFKAALNSASPVSRIARGGCTILLMRFKEKRSCVAWIAQVRPPREFPEVEPRWRREQRTAERAAKLARRLAEVEALRKQVQKAEAGRLY